MKVINDYGIVLKIGYFVIDNVGNNDIMMDALSTCMSSICIWFIIVCNTY